MLKMLLSSIAATLALLLLAGSLAQDHLLARSVDSNGAELSFSEPAAPVSAPALSPRVVVKPLKTAHAVAAEPSSSHLLAVVHQADIQPRHQELANEVLRLLPSACRDHLRNFYVRYDKPERRGMGGKSTIILDGTVPDGEFIALLIHECGHVIHANLEGTPASGESGFRDGTQIFYADSPSAAFFAISWQTERVLRREARDGDFVSGYAKADAFEDFSETLAAYVLQHDGLVKRAAQNPALARKVRWMDTYLFPSDPVLSEGGYTWKGANPWDITKLPFTWLPMTVANR